MASGKLKAEKPKGSRRAMKRPSVLAIGGFDPSGGAGILADVKTLEVHKVHGLGVCTGITFQSPGQITGIDWLSRQAVQEQIDRCFETHPFRWAKIGAARDTGMLTAIAMHLKEQSPDIKIIWDPVIKASSGRTFLENVGAAEFEQVLQHIYLATPNLEEMALLYNGKPEIKEKELHEQCLRLSREAGIYLKGGHSKTRPGKDFLFQEGKRYPLNPRKKRLWPKHGSGCVFASSLTANLAKGFPLQIACLRSKRHIEKFLSSSEGLLGWHL